jgi:hypothetical protein
MTGQTVNDMASGVPAAGAPADGALLARGVCRALAAHGMGALTEFTFKDGHRADVIGLGGDGAISVVEVKSSRRDFLSDGKWPAYTGFCDRFYFAVPPDFPLGLLPEGCGLWIADAYHAELVREAPTQKLSAARRRAVTLRFARVASQRLLRASDPNGVPERNL